ncbi:MAG: sigma-70 family RNA polymerase sigma factor, partial [Planctomycetaceae bacterium]
MHAHGIPSERVQRLREGESAALGELFSLCQKRLRQMLHFRLDHRLTRRVDVDDVLQEAFIDAAKRLTHLQQTDDDASAYVWLRLVTLQTLADTHRFHLGAQARDMAREVPTRDASAQSTARSMAHMLVGRLTSPSQAIQRVEAIEQVQAALELMTPIDQEILALRNFEELTNTEAAEILKIEPGTASLRFIRALKRLQQMMVQFPDSERTW